jgi:putative hemolysin
MSFAILFGLIALNAVFSGAEIAVLSVRKSRLQELAEDGRLAAVAALKLRANPEQFLATVQIGITVVGAAAGAFGGAQLAEPFADSLQRLGAGEWAHSFAFVLIVSLISFLSVVFGELVPKSIALRASERYALLVAGSLYELSRLAKPVVWFLTWTSNLVLRPLHDRTTFTEARMSPDELQQLVEEATDSGAIDPRTAEITARALDLGALHAHAVMVPRSQIAWMPGDATAEAALRVLTTTKHSRYPVKGDDEQDIPGYVLARDIQQQLLAGAFDLKTALRKIPFFPERVPAVQLLVQLQAARSRIALVVDDYGAISGLVSTEDIAEELLGEMLTEYDRAEVNIQRDGEDWFIVRGTTPLHELNRELDLDLPTSPQWSTIAGLVNHEAGEIPPPGRLLTLDDEVEVEVLDATMRGVKLLRLRRLAKESPELG